MLETEITKEALRKNCERTRQSGGERFIVGYRAFQNLCRAFAGKSLQTDRKRLVAAAEIWQACDRCRRYQTLTCFLARRPLCASNRKLAGSQCARHLNGSSRKLRTGAADPEQPFAFIFKHPS